MSDYTTIKLSKHGKNKNKYIAIVDSIDADLAQLNWTVNILPHGNTIYAYNYRSNQIPRFVKLHRIILARKLERDELLPTELVDHINGNGLDCRRENLRLATPSQNQHNRRMSHNNTSGYKGVHKSKKGWIARIQINGNRIYLGYFDTPEQANEACMQKREELHGEFANHGIRED